LNMRRKSKNLYSTYVSITVLLVSHKEGKMAPPIFRTEFKNVFEMALVLKQATLGLLNNNKKTRVKYLVPLSL
jgi:hypothetical protein